MPSRKELLAIPGIGPSFLRSCEEACLVPEPIRDSTRPGRPYVYPDEAIEILAALTVRRRTFGRIEAVGFATWWDGFDVPMPGIRKILDRVMRTGATTIRREEVKYGSLEGVASEAADQAGDLPSLNRRARSKVGTYLRQAHGDEIQGALSSVFAIIDPAGNSGETRSQWSAADFGRAAELEKLTEAPESSAVSFRDSMVESGLSSVAGWSALLDGLADGQLVSVRDCLRSIADGPMDLPALDVFLRDETRWRTRARAVVLLAAISPFLIPSP